MIKESARISAKIEGSILRIEICGEIDHHSASKLRDGIDKLIYMHRPEVLELGLSKVTFMDSSGLGLIAGRVAAAQNISARVILCDVTEQIMKILKLAGTDKISGLTVIEKEKKIHAKK